MQILQLIARIFAKQHSVTYHEETEFGERTTVIVSKPEGIGHKTRSLNWSLIITQPTPTTIRLRHIIYNYTYASSYNLGLNGHGRRSNILSLTHTHISLADPELLDKIEEQCKSSNSSLESSQNEESHIPTTTTFQ